MRKRLARDLEEFDRKAVPLLSPSLKEDILSLELFPPSDNLFFGITLKLNFSFPRDYPFRPPFIYFNPPIFHPNITPEGIFNLYSKPDNWTPAHKIEHMVINIYSILSNPIPCNMKNKDDKGKEEDDGEDNCYANELAAEIWNDKDTVRSINFSLTK